MAELNFESGDYVILRLALEEVEGRVLESPDSSIILLKLKSGYNIGINKENILGAKVLRKFKEEKVKFELPKTKGLPSIGLVVTGGTIASKLDPKTGGAKHLTDINEFARTFPEIFKIANVKIIESPFMIASESMNSEHWIKIAQSVKKLLDDEDISGVIVTHGTDTLGYTSAALSFFLRNLNKPVVLTYSQRSIDRASSDADLNLQCAARMAISDVAEVIIVGHSSTNDDFCYAMPGTKTRKLHSSGRDAFKVVNASPIAKVWPDKVEFISGYRPRNKGKTELDLDFSDKVALIKFYPGQDSSILDFHALKYKGIVVEASGLGHLPSSEASNNWIPKLKKLIKGGFVVCVASQTIYGRLDPYVYSNARELLDVGVIFLEDMLAETAFVKLGFVLGHYGWKKDVKEKMLSNMAGEMNKRLGLTEEKC
ncbi:MAG TPA: Glu-tRNA(Gln) amidotransferase subunit GatD [Candidatus Nanoarchaeia archaeon]|nr:Glu-tRNA(Gln) amidotransferase subunit GatD [Candidatus Nanoarchaeia archaeon]